jgi:serine/threonine-protein kinase
MIGQTVSHYKILGKLGEGGMGVVYKAQDTKLKRMVALKFLPKDLIASQDSKKRFKREAEAVALLNHPNIITIHEIDEHQGRSYMVMEYVEGETLKQKIEKSREIPCDLKKIREMVIIAIQICRGLLKAHQANIIHRDIKPANILINEDDQVKIMDFGLAKLTDASKITRDTSTLGTVHYMSPEQIESSEIDIRADIWSFGAVLYELITGRVPFMENYLQALFFSIMNEQHQPISELCSLVPPELETLINHCLEKDPDKRYPDLTEVLGELKAIKKKLESQTQAAKIIKIKYRRQVFRKLTKIAAPLAVLLLVILFTLIPNPGRQALKNWLFLEKIPEKKYLAALPLVNPDKEPLQQAYANGTTARLIDKLTGLEQFHKQFWVVPISELRQYKITSVKKAIKSVYVTLVLTGSLKLDGDKIIHEFNLVDASNRKTLRTSSLTNHITNLSGLQDGMIKNITEMLDLQLSPAAENTLFAGGTSMPGAYQLYLQGLGFLQESENKNSIGQSIEMFKQALEQDNSYDEAHASLGKACLFMYRLTKEKNWLEKAKANCNRALEINKRLLSVYLTRGYIQREQGNHQAALNYFQHAEDLNTEYYPAILEKAQTYYFDLGENKKAEEAFKQAIGVRENYWQGHKFLAYFYWRASRLPEAEREMLRVIDLNPADLWTYKALFGIYIQRTDEISTRKTREIFEKAKQFGADGELYSNMATNLYYQKQYTEAMDMYLKAIELAGDSPWTFRIWGNLADSYQMIGGNNQKAEQAYREAVRLVREKLSEKPADAPVRASLALYLAKLNTLSQASLEINRALKRNPNDLDVIKKSIIVFELCGKRKRALDCLGEFIKRHGALGELTRNPFLTGLHRDPAYRKLVTSSVTAAPTGEQ